MLSPISFRSEVVVNARCKRSREISPEKEIFRWSKIEQKEKQDQ